MRTKTEILSDGTKTEKLILEVLLDIRELLKKKPIAKNKNKNIKGK